MYATLPPPHLKQMKVVANHPLIYGFRLNTGVRTPYSPHETLERILDVKGDKKFAVDLKAGQLRIKKWADPHYSEIELNHELKIIGADHGQVDLNPPATIYFRGGGKSKVVAVQGRYIFVDPIPPYAVGAGQSVNIHHQGNLQIVGFLTETCEQYLEACKKLGIKDIWLSFVESRSQIDEVKKHFPEAKLCLKIESPLGLDFVRNEYPKLIKLEYMLMAARDDLFLNIGADKLVIFAALQLIIEKDPQAILASRLFTSVEKINEKETPGEPIALGDLSDLYLMHQVFGYQSFLLSDNLCHDERAFAKAMEIIGEYQKKFVKDK